MRRPRGTCPVCGDDVPVYNGPRFTVGRHRGRPRKAGCPGQGQTPWTGPWPRLSPPGPRFWTWSCPVCAEGTVVWWGANLTATSPELLEENVELHELIAHGIEVAA